MIGYVTLGTNDLQRAAKFYDALAAELGTKRMMEYDTFIAWGEMGGAAGIGLTKPFDGAAATVGNGVMVALQCKDQAQVDCCAPCWPIPRPGNWSVSSAIGEAPSAVARLYPRLA